MGIVKSKKNKKNKKNKLVYWGLAIALLAGTSVMADLTADPLKTAVATRIDGRIHIDGHPAEKAWSNARAFSDFTQYQPVDGAKPTDSTKVAILYDDEAVYFAFWCYDSDPEKISHQLTRRDRYTESDKVSVRIDSHHDHQTAYCFCVNAGGVMRDLLIYNNDCSDDSWDAVWEAATQITPNGWTAEIKIPYSALRFAEEDEYEWGLFVDRYIPRRDELNHWQYVPRHEAGGVSSYGHLVGIENIEPPSRMETLPYMVSYGVTEPKSLGNANGQQYFSDVGVDFKYGVSSSITLDAAVNPDFGQVESDNSVINLSTFETFYEEKRPFFLEGAEIFRNPYFNQFYSRRIGRAPRRWIDEADYYIDRPSSTTILTSLKLTGKTKTGTAFGVLNATTREETAKYGIEEDNSINEAVIEPMANYSVVRVKQDLYGSSYIGGMLTSANQKDETDAYTASTDLRLYFNRNMYSFGGSVIGTNNGPGTGDMAMAVHFNKNSGRIIRGNINVDYFGRDVDWNRLGFMGRNSTRGVGSWIQLYSNKVFSIFKSHRLNFNYWYNENLDGYRGSTGGNVNGSVNFTNNWWFNAGIGRDASRFDDRETRGNGLFHIGHNYRQWFGMGTNSARKFSFDFNFHHDNERDGFFYQYCLWANYRMLTNLEFSLSTSYRINRDVDYWVGELSASDTINADMDPNHGLPVFGKLDNNDVDITLRSTYTFRRNMTIQLYTQFYISTGEYDTYRKLTTPNELDDIDYENYYIDYSRGDFNYKALNLNLVFRWEYLPGSTLYLVWTQGRDSYDTGYGDFDFSRDFDDIFSLPQTNTFLVKANYWWNI